MDQGASALAAGAASCVFIDSEISPDSGKVRDLGAVWPDGRQFHSTSPAKFAAFLSGAEFVCGHNILAHDLKYIGPLVNTGQTPAPMPIDTLPLSPLLFPKRPYHRLVKDDKLQTEELNDPLNDAIKSMELFYDEINAFFALSPGQRQAYCALLSALPEFQGFFHYLRLCPTALNGEDIKTLLAGRVCAHADVDTLIRSYPAELAYALALIAADDHHSLTPPWVMKNYPATENIIRLLRATPCAEGCEYCRDRLDVGRALKAIFNFDSFRTYNGEPLQERAAAAAVAGRSLLAVFPTGGGKSLTFQLPALMAAQAEHGLTVVISPLQSLMKDQVDNLERLGIVDAVTINGLLSPIERAEALDRVSNGLASLLYISPEQLRSATIERLLLGRNVVRFVIDEAHCFSAWGQEFRVDYQHIGAFIRQLQINKGRETPIPVSCFTATAKPKVISDIRDYFKRELNVDLDLFTTEAERKNLRYFVVHLESEEGKYNYLRSLIEQKNCPTIVYVSRVRRTRELAEKLSCDGFPALAYNGKMDPADKVACQEAFISNRVQVMVATSAFGMGVDKKDVGLVIHYDISDSLENYVQEAGRAGRDEDLEADCYVLFNDQDLDQHFLQLNQTKLSFSEIQQVWKAIKDLTRIRPKVSCSPLEIARQAGWDDAMAEIETRVKSAVAALENAGYVRRGRNMPRVYASSIRARNMSEAGQIIDASPLFNDGQRRNAKRIVSSLISNRSIAKASLDQGEARVDYLADWLGLEKADVLEAVNLMRQAGLLADMLDMSAYIRRSDSQNKSALILNRFLKLERFLLSQLAEEGNSFNLKELNQQALDQGLPFATVQRIRTIFYYWQIKGYVIKDGYSSERKTHLAPAMSLSKLNEKFERRVDICRFVLDSLFAAIPKQADPTREEAPVEFSLLGLYEDYCQQPRLEAGGPDPVQADIEDSLLYLSKIGSLTLEGGFLVTYCGMELQRLIFDNKIKYKREDYRTLDSYYRQRIQQIHIVGAYANLMVRNYQAALQFVRDYFQLDFKSFIAKYFAGARAAEIERNIRPEQYHQLFGVLSPRQRQIIEDDSSQLIVVAAGPGSGKTRVLVHKLASLLLLEDVKRDQLLMLTFSRSAATEFKKRLIALIGPSAAYVEIKTFHSYCFDLLGKVGSLAGVEDVVADATQMIINGEVEMGRIAKTVLVIDEAQDMSKDEFALVQALLSRNDNLRLIAVGDDDQNIYEFRHSDSRFMRSLIIDQDAVKYEMVENFRSRRNIVALANAFANRIGQRMKTAPIQAVNEEDGKVQLVRHHGPHLEEPLVDHVISTYRQGSAAVLTATNDQALRVLSLLTKRGVRAKLIQSIDGFQLDNLAELRYFLHCIDEKLTTPVIAEDLWTEAGEMLADEYKESACLDLCQALLADFAAINRVKYRTDLGEFIRESHLEDFCRDERETVLVSTIHKSKGREFDSVYMLLDRVKAETDEEKRKLYVGLTRAKQELYIHYNNGVFDGFDRPGVEQVFDETLYPEPEQLILSLTHRDVALGSFKGAQQRIISLHSGDELGVTSNALFTVKEGHRGFVGVFSKAFQTKLAGLAAKGYRPYRAQVRFIVAWKNEQNQEETLIVLPDLYLRKDAGKYKQ